MKQNKEDGLIKKLMEYKNSDMYPYHMPGHKRQLSGINPYDIDITEIAGFDNLHAPEGIIKDCMENAKHIYRSDKSYFLINGSSCGVLSAVCASAGCEGKILMARNCHKSVYHAVFLNHLNAEYIYPESIPGYAVQGGIDPKKLSDKLKEHAKGDITDIQAVVMVSPTYDGIVSDIAAIAETVHKYHIPLIVDEAHGAHFNFADEYFPKSALDLGADIVIQSLHKTLPALTQTAVMHVKGNLANTEKIEEYLRIFETSSPSYVLMASIDSCIRYMDTNGRRDLKNLESRLKEFYKASAGLKNIKLWSSDIIGQYGIYDIDYSKIILSVNGTKKTGIWLADKLRNDFHIETEMAGEYYVMALTSICDTDEGFLRLKKALVDIDEHI